jgi:hypothetical protein
LSDFDKHLVIGNIPVDPGQLSGPLSVFTSDGQELTDYFHIVSIDKVSASVDKLTTITLTIYGSIGYYTGGIVTGSKTISLDKDKL